MFLHPFLKGFVLFVFEIGSCFVAQTALDLNPSATASRGMGLQACTTTPSFKGVSKKNSTGLVCNLDVNNSYGQKDKNGHLKGWPHFMIISVQKSCVVCGMDS
jgi:hypothetical protein